MARRWTAAVTAVLAAVALACEGGAEGGRPPRPPDSPRPGLPSSIAALGDSITTGFGSCLVLAACQHNSWATGRSTRVDSLYRRLLEVNPAIRGNVRNVATNGARVGDLVAQARTAVRAEADYVTVLVGANDACRNRVEEMTEVATFRDRLDQALRVVREGRPRAQILVLSIPDLYRLWEVGHTEERVVRAWGNRICPTLLANATSTAEADRTRRSTFRARIDAYNRELSAACRAYGSRCRYDGGAVHRVRFSLDMVNHLDYFHPDVEGQRRLAEVAWRASGLARRAD
ncbi:GDSL-type esterase/lipase family protein [Micromonospora sp. HM5-17]|jgi:lysophospholipase L1-like esterase|uniref:GDSL-type esterase/lipase family protein n=1 Tax=Micromonospora sp. HM5-17 TaxID=2487710 RepID=UPI000F46A01A|nr:GDSL-type esterase/lipase family protein [Micromonospora sp. HM5-17]ROT33212.1 SGNH/GDSL hydrolase family protein [Micromonospora sp. HM5-17]